MLLEAEEKKKKKKRRKRRGEQEEGAFRFLISDFDVKGAPRLSRYARSQSPTCNLGAHVATRARARARTHDVRAAAEERTARARREEMRRGEESGGAKRERRGPGS